MRCILIAKFDEAYRQLQKDAIERKNNSNKNKSEQFFGTKKNANINVFYKDDSISYLEINLSNEVSLEGSTVELIKTEIEDRLPVIKGNQMIRYNKSNALFIGDADFTTGYAKGMLRYGNEEPIEIDVKGGENDEKGLLFEKDGQPPAAWLKK